MKYPAHALYITLSAFPLMISPWSKEVQHACRAIPWWVILAATPIVMPLGLLAVLFLYQLPKEHEQMRMLHGERIAFFFTGSIFALNIFGCLLIEWIR